MKRKTDDLQFWEIPEQQETVKRERKNRNIREPEKKEKKEKASTGYVQEYINIKDIRNGIVETKDGRYVKILEIEPINFDLRTPEEQNAIIHNFAGWLKISNVKLQFKSITKKADTDKHIRLLRETMAKEDNEQTKELSRAYIKLIRDVGSKEALTRRFFVIMEFEYQMGMQRGSTTYEDIYNTLTTAALTAKSYFAKCGNSVVEPDNEDVFLCEFFYMFYNRRSSMEEPFISRLNKVVKDTMIASGRILGVDEPPAIPVINYIAPRGIDLSHSSYIVMDGLYYTYLYIKPENGYLPTVRAGWMSLLVNAGEGIDVDLFFTRANKSKVQEQVSRKVRLNNIKLKSTYDSSTDYEDIRDAITGGYYIKEMLKNNNDLLYMSILITISATTYEGLLYKKRIISDYIKAQDMQSAELKFRQENALNSVTPLLQLDKDIYKKSRRNIMTQDAASTYMFTSFEMSDDNGILLGINQYNQSLCIVDIFNSKVYKNANMFIIGTSGAGKTFTLQLMALRMRMLGIQTFIIAPLKGHEFRRACKNIGGTFIEISPASAQCINIMEIRIPDISTDEIIEGTENVQMDSLLAKKMQQLSIFMSLLLPDMTNEESQLLDEAIIDTYARKGISMDNSTLYREDEPDKLKEMPIIEDLFNQLDNNLDTKRLATVLKRFVTGSAQSFNSQTNIDLNNKYVVIDLSNLQGTLLAVGMFIALDFVWDKTKEDRTKKKAIFTDEAWSLIGPTSNKKAAEFLLEIFKIIRGYGGSAIAATQDVNDAANEYGKGIINNCKTKIILGLEPAQAELAKEEFKLSETEYMDIPTFSRGEALITSNNNKVRVNIKPSQAEKDLITTDRAELEAQARQKIEEARIAEKKARDEELAANRIY